MALGGGSVAAGVDVVAVERIARLDERGDLEGRVFTAGEIAEAGTGRRRHERLAARFAAKEAVLKAIGTGKRGDMRWTDVEVVAGGSGAPSVRLHGAVAAAAAERGVGELSLSLSHEGGLAVAVAVALRAPSGPGERR